MRLYKNSSLKSKSTSTIRRFRSEFKLPVPCVPIGIIFGRRPAALAPARRVPYRFRVREERGPGHVRPRRRPTRDSHLAAGAMALASLTLPVPLRRDAPSRAPSRPASSRRRRQGAPAFFFFLEEAKGDVHSLIFIHTVRGTQVDSFTQLPKQRTLSR